MPMNPLRLDLIARAGSVQVSQGRTISIARQTMDTKVDVKRSKEQSQRKRRRQASS